MAELIYSCAFRIAVAAILGAVFEYILPDGGLKKSARRAVALALIIIVAEPLQIFA
jgi:hypothetical protein